MVIVARRAGLGAARDRLEHRSRPGSRQRRDAASCSAGLWSPELATTQVPACLGTVENYTRILPAAGGYPRWSCGPAAGRATRCPGDSAPAGGRPRSSPDSSRQRLRERAGGFLLPRTMSAPRQPGERDRGQQSHMRAPTRLPGLGPPEGRLAPWPRDPGGLCPPQEAAPARGAKGWPVQACCSPEPVSCQGADGF